MFVYQISLKIIVYNKKEVVIVKYTRTSNYSYNLHVIKTDKFKTVTVQMNFKRELKKEEITARNLIVSALCESTGNYPTKRNIAIAKCCLNTNMDWKNGPIIINRIAKQ